MDFVDNYDSFLLATGEQADSYYNQDKTHINMAGTRKLLKNNGLHRIINTHPVYGKRRNWSVTNLNYNNSGFNRNHNIYRNNNKQSKYCHICYRSGNHTTGDCWYNGRNERPVGRMSWQENKWCIKQKQFSISKRHIPIKNSKSVKVIDSKSEPYIQPSGLSQPNSLLADLLPYRSPGPSVTDCLTTQFDFSSSKNVTHIMSSLDDTDPSENEDLCDLTFRSKGLHVANLNVRHLFSNWMNYG